MCNLYSLTSNQQAIRDLARGWTDLIGNMPTLPGIFPDYAAPSGPGGVANAPIACPPRSAT